MTVQLSATLKATGIATRQLLAAVPAPFSEAAERSCVTATATSNISMTSIPTRKSRIGIAQRRNAPVDSIKDRRSAVLLHFSFLFAGSAWLEFMVMASDEYDEEMMGKNGTLPAYE